MSDSENIEYWKSRLEGKTFVEEEGNHVNDQRVTASQLPAMHRVIRPGQPITKDFQMDRLNLQLDSDDKIRAVGFY